MAPHLYLVDQKQLTTIEGYDTSLECYVLVGDENDLTWTWKVKGVTLSSSARINITSDGKKSIISFKNTELSDEGEYECTVQNLHGSHSRSSYLNIKSKIY